MAEKMRSLRKYLDEAQLEIFPTEQNEIRHKEPTEAVVKPVDEALPTERQT